MSKLLQNYRNKPLDDEDGFTLKEVVITVAVILIVSLLGFISYQGFIDNARTSAVDRAANEVFTAAVASETVPDGAPLQEIEDEYNRTSGDDLRVEIEKDAETRDITVTAYGWEDNDPPYTAVRSTDSSRDGSDVIVPDEDEEEEDTSYTGNIDDYDDGVFEFTVNAPSKIFIQGLSSNIKLIHEGEELTIREGQDEERPNTILPSAGTYTIRGGFEKIGTGRVDVTSVYDTTANFVSVDTWEDTGTIDVEGLFGYANSLEYVDAPPATVQNMTRMFINSSFNQDVSDWDVSNVTDMTQMFYGARSFNNGGEALDWGEKTRNVENMRRMFSATGVTTRTVFDQPIDDWNVSRVTDMSGMFYNGVFNQPLNSWDTSNVEYMNSMFATAVEFNQPIHNWNTSKVKNMQKMFDNAISFNQPLNTHGSSWNTGNVEDMSNMFYNVRVFDQDIGDWNTSNVKDMQKMFYNARMFNQDISNWETGKVTNMSNMFDSARKFNAPIGKWDTSNVENMTSMFEYASQFNQDINSWKVPNISSKPTDFDTSAHAGFINNSDRQPQWGVS